MREFDEEYIRLRGRMVTLTLHARRYVAVAEK